MADVFSPPQGKRSGSGRAGCQRAWDHDQALCSKAVDDVKSVPSLTRRACPRQLIFGRKLSNTIRIRLVGHRPPPIQQPSLGQDIGTRTAGRDVSAFAVGFEYQHLGFSFSYRYTNAIGFGVSGKMTSNSAKTVLFIVSKVVKLLDLAGPMQVFMDASDVSDHRYEVIVASKNGGAVTSDTVLPVASVPLSTLRDEDFDTLIIAGGSGVKDAADDADHRGPPRANRQSPGCAWACRRRANTTPSAAK